MPRSPVLADHGFQPLSTPRDLLGRSAERSPGRWGTPLRAARVRRQCSRRGCRARPSETPESAPTHRRLLGRQARPTGRCQSKRTPCPAPSQLPSLRAAPGTRSRRAPAGRGSGIEGARFDPRDRGNSFAGRLAGTRSGSSSSSLGNPADRVTAIMRRAASFPKLPFPCNV